MCDACFKWDRGKTYTAQEYMDKYPHITGGEAEHLAYNANIGNAVGVPRTGIGTGNGHMCFGSRCICHELGKEDGDSYYD